MKKHRLHRFKIQITQIMVLVSVLGFLVSEGFAKSISSSELINSAKQLDGKTVVYQGEVIGDIMKRGHNSWVNVNDGANAIGIWLESVLAKDIRYAGAYKSRGDLVEVVGVFNRACQQHGGDLDIHGQQLVIIKSGYPIVENFEFSKRNAALVLCAILGVLWILSRLRKPSRQN